MKPGLAFALLLAAATAIGLVLWLSTSSGADAQPPAPTAGAQPDTSGERRASNVDKPLDDLAASGPSPAPEREARGVAAYTPRRGPTGSLLVRATWGSTGKPAVNVQVCVKRVYGPSVDAVRSRTDASGTALFESVGPGLIFASGDRSGRTEPLWIEAGSRAEAQLVFEPGLTVTGRVMTADGRSVSNAQIWARPFAEWCALTEADASGRFRVEEVNPGSKLIATARDHAPSREALATGAAGDSVTLDFELRDAATSLLGQVVDPDEHVVSKAVVLLEYGNFGLFGDGARWSTTCDAEGRFVFHSVPPGKCTLVVQSADFAPAVLEPRVVLGERQELIVRLEPGAELAGVVRHADKPVAGAVVLVGRPGSFLQSWGCATTDAQGRYRISGLPPGVQAVGAARPAESKEWTSELRSNELNAAEAEIELIAGRSVIWNAELKRNE